MRNSFIIWTIVLVVFSVIRLNAQIQFEASPDYGQIYDVTFDPNHQDVLYARTVSNHIVKSTNHGADWEVIHSVPQENWVVNVKELRLTNNGNSLSYLCIAEGNALNRVEILDLNTNEVQKQIFSPLGDVNGSLVQTYSVFNDDTDTVLLHTTKIVNWGLVTEIFYTTDAGLNWKSVYFGPDNGNINVNNVAISPFDSQKLFIMRGGSPNPIEGGLLISDDAGETWTEKLPETNFYALTFNPSNADDIFLGTFYLGAGQEQNLYRSQDGGENWDIVEIDWTTMSTNSIHSITYNPLDLNQIMILEENEIVVSYDRGATWTNYVYSFNSEDYYYGLTASFNPFVNNEVLISANYYPFISQDGGETLSRLRSPFVNPSGRMAVFNGEENHVYYGLRNGFMHKDLQDGTEEAYNLFPIDNLPMFSSSGIYTDPNVVGRVFQSTMGGIMGSSALAVSNNHGENLQTILTGNYLMLMAVGSFEPNPNKIVVSMGESIYKLDITDLENVATQEITAPGFDYVTSTIFDTTNDEVFYITQKNKAYKTEDNGQTWQELFALEDAEFVYELTINPLNENEFAIATTQGIFKSEDKGENWTQIYGGGPINTVQFSHFEEGKIVASSIFEDGAYYPASDAIAIYTKNGGEAWAEIGTDDLGYLRSNSTKIMFNNENEADVYFLVQDLGLVKYTLDLTTLGTGEINSNISEVTIYPNPTNGVLNFNSKSEVQNVSVFDLSGRKISEFNSNQINISSLSKGIYLVKISTKDGKTITRKVVKK